LDSIAPAAARMGNPEDRERPDLLDIRPHSDAASLFTLMRHSWTASDKAGDLTRDL
jgi:hypothetical protein